MRVGVIGLGSIGRRHVGNLLALGCEVVGLDTNPTALLSAKADYPALSLDGGPVDALVFATPAANHLERVEEAVSHRIPFFVEKPLGTLEQLPRWREIAEMDLPVNQVGYMLRFQRDVAFLKSLAPRNGELWLRWDAERYGYRLEESSHEIDLALHLGADADAVVAQSRGEIWLGGQWVVSINDRAPRYWRQWNAHSRCGAVIQESLAVFRSPEELGTEMYRLELEHFLSCVQSGTPTICPLADGLKVLEVCASIEAMSKATA